MDFFYLDHLNYIIKYLYKQNYKCITIWKFLNTVIHHNQFSSIYAFKFNLNLICEIATKMYLSTFAENLSSFEGSSSWSIKKSDTKMG